MRPFDLLLGADGAPTDLARIGLRSATARSWWTNIRTRTRCRTASSAAISREGKNLFTVGDVKQSIYRFRLADPRIFLDHYLRLPARLPTRRRARAQSSF